MRETQQSICAWADETFDAAASVQRVLGRANEEMAELIRKATAGPALDAAGIAEEAADVAIILCRATRMLGGEELFDKDLAEDVKFAKTRTDPAWEIAAGANVYLSAALHASRRAREKSLRGVLICFDQLAILCATLGRDLLAEIDLKMAVNRTRAWTKDGTGHGYHLRDKGAA